MAKAKKASKSRSVKRKSNFSHKQFILYILVFAVVGAATLFISFAAPVSCTRNTPGVNVDNNYAWAQWGSWGYPGQTLKYDVHVTNYDVGCGSSTFTVNTTAPDGYVVSNPSTTVSVSSSSQSSYFFVPVTSPTSAAAGDTPITFTVTRSGNTAPDATTTNYYKVYTTDTTAPTPYWPNPWDGQVISKKQSKSSFQMVVSANDDHAVKTLSIYVDGNLLTTANCDDISYTCQASYKLPLRGLAGPHVATFKATDWFNNVGTITSSFTIN